MNRPSILPPRSTALQKAMEQVAADLLDLPVPLRALWSPHECPIEQLPWLAWGLSVDIWDANWSEAVKRAAVADAIAFQRRKGTPASLRTVLDRFDPMIGMMEWFEDRDTMEPFTFRLEMPLRADSDVIYDDALVEQIMRDIAQVKPVRAHMTAVFKLVTEARAWLLSAAALAGQHRQKLAVDTKSSADPIWDSYLQTEDGEPLLAETGTFMQEQL